ncbi:hypothetical protein GPJ56_008291 [Histomonas meleagridis]|uniref:uncharacterized protein n=1 Tax=Histomonas meleagridis TaxID=135588 RepID=UPI003559A300|nr:hypothetical protein GPJ56_008291 [Histomonas meleagridis]KAH0806861.1 hypothetical protein GO595_000037 [Histomonas meleagridis]
MEKIKRSRTISEMLWKYEGDPKEKEEIIKILKEYHFTDIVSFLFSSISRYREKHTEAIVYLVFDLFDENQRHLFAYYCVHNDLFFFFCCCDAGVFTADDVIESYNIILPPDLINRPQSNLVPELEITLGPEELMETFKYKPDHYQDIRKDCWAQFRRCRRYPNSKAFDFAIMDDDVETIKSLYPRGDYPEVTNYKIALATLISHQHPILSAAVLFNSRKVIDFFIEQKVPINATNPHGWRAIHSAAFIGDIELFERFYNMGEHDIQGCLCAAICGRSNSMVDHLITNHDMSLETDHYFNLSALWFAFEFRNYYIIEKFIEKGFDTNTKNSEYFELVFLPKSNDIRPGILPQDSQQKKSL